MIALMAAGVYSITRSPLAAYGIVSFIGLILYTVNHFKMMITGGVLVPTDIFAADSAFRILMPGSVRIMPGLVVVVILVLLLHIPLYFIKVNIKWPERIMAFSGTAALFLIIFASGFTFSVLFPALGLERGTVTERYRDHGLLLGFYSEWVLPGSHTAPDIEVTTFQFLAAALAEPRLYVNEHASEYVMEGNELETKLESEPEKINPNVIVIMSEAFMDPTVLKNLTFSQYPIPHFRRLSETEESISGNVLVPVYGGLTSNTEFEFLGGSPHVFFGSRLYNPYENPGKYFNREIKTALPWLFRQNGYKTVGVHPYHGDFFNRSAIYPLIGFEEFISLEHMPEARYHGYYVSDEYFTDRIIEQILLAENEGTPLFLFGISMQNHWGYDYNKYGGHPYDFDVSAESPYIDNNVAARVNSYLQGIYDADKQLGRLADFIGERETPTLLVFFGDHLPILGLHVDRVFEDLGYVSHQEEFLWNLDDRINMFQTPYLVWANYPFGQGDWGTVSAYLFGALAAEASGIDLNRYFLYLLHGHGEFKGITNELYLDAGGGFHDGRKNIDKPHVKDLYALWYANLFGGDDIRSYLAEIINNK
jgi:phosphoglycerol transferase MdoB-like AlkP superfamily enzyme